MPPPAKLTRSGARRPHQRSCSPRPALCSGPATVPSVRRRITVAATWSPRDARTCHPPRHGATRADRRPAARGVPALDGVRGAGGAAGRADPCRLPDRRDRARRARGAAGPGRLRGRAVLRAVRVAAVPAVGRAPARDRRPGPGARRYSGAARCASCRRTGWRCSSSCCWPPRDGRARRRAPPTRPSPRCTAAATCCADFTQTWSLCTEVVVLPRPAARSRSRWSPAGRHGSAARPARRWWPAPGVDRAGRRRRAADPGEHLAARPRRLVRRGMLLATAGRLTRPPTGGTPGRLGRDFADAPASLLAVAGGRRPGRRAPPSPVPGRWPRRRRRERRQGAALRRRRDLLVVAAALVAAPAHPDRAGARRPGRPVVRGRVRLRRLPLAPAGAATASSSSSTCPLFGGDACCRARHGRRQPRGRRAVMDLFERPLLERWSRPVSARRGRRATGVSAASRASSRRHAARPSAA